MGNFWFAFDWKKYEDDTSDLFLVQHGAYLQLLMHYYKSGLPLPQDTERLTRISRAHTEEEIRAVSDVLQRYFVLKSDGWHNKRADEELSKMRRISKVRSNAARSKSSANASANAEAKPNQLPTQLTTNNKQKAESKAKAASAFVTPDWVPKEEWAEFEKMRRTIRKPMTDKARSLIVGELFKLRSRGHDPKLVLEQSISNSWQGVFELKGESIKSTRPQEVAHSWPDAARQTEELVAQLKREGRL